MWTDDDELEYEIKRTKFQSGAGCLIVGIILLMLAIVSAVSLSSKLYDKIKPQDKELVMSKFPDRNHTIKVVEKGTILFVDPTVVITYEKYKIEREISNNNEDLHSSNILISWKNNDEATILLYGKKQSPEIIEFKVPNKGSKANPFQVVQREIGFVPFQKSKSPNNFNVVELRRNTYSKGMMRFYNEFPIQVYYGKNGSDLQKYGEFSGSDQYKMDSFQIIWDDDQHVTINARESINDTPVDTIKIEFK